MGVCESTSKAKEKNIPKIIPMPDTDKISKKKQINEEENSNNLDTHPSSNSQENENKVPELIKYDQDHSGKKSEISFVNSRHGSLSSNQKEEELIIRGEINKTNINKEEDFDNMDFKDLIVQSGGIVIKDKDKDKMSNVYSYQGINPAYDFHKEAISEIKSKHSFPFKTTNKSNIHDKLKGRKDNLDLINNRRGGEIDNENNSNLIDILAVADGRRDGKRTGEGAACLCHDGLAIVDDVIESGFVVGQIVDRRYDEQRFYNVTKIADVGVGSQVDVRNFLYIVCDVCLRYELSAVSRLRIRPDPVSSVICRDQGLAACLADHRLGSGEAVLEIVAAVERVLGEVCGKIVSCVILGEHGVGDVDGLDVSSVNARMVDIELGKFLPDGIEVLDGILFVGGDLSHGDTARSGGLVRGPVPDKEVSGRAPLGLGPAEEGEVLTDGNDNSYSVVFSDSQSVDIDRLVDAEPLIRFVKRSLTAVLGAEV